ncbi:MAG: cytochrome c oxidase assembly factor Coa1 family protein [Candidatus Pristimantibacillus sp.]
MVRRIGSFIIDYFIIMLVVAGIFFIAMNPEDMEFDALLLRMKVVLYSAYMLNCCKDIIGGRSIGKRLFGLAVRDNKNNVPSIWRLMTRNLLSFLWPVELIMILASRQKKKIGDRLVHTDVYLVAKNRGIAGIIVFIISMLSLFVLLIGVFIVGIMQIIKQDASYKLATDYIKANPEIREIVGEEMTFGRFSSGSISYENGFGTSELTIKVKGSKDTLSVHIVSHKELGSSWIIEDVDYKEKVSGPNDHISNE